MDYTTIVRVIARKCGLPRDRFDEAWEAMNTAYLTLDKSRSEGEQASYLITSACNIIKVQLPRQDYVDRTSGVRRLVSVDFQFSCMFAVKPDRNSDRFLEVFPEGLVREYADHLADGGKFGYYPVKYWLRQRGNCSRVAAKELYESTRIYAKKLLGMDRVPKEIATP